MTEQLAVQFIRDALTLTLLLAGPLLGAALLVGLVISVFQAVTQINEMTLTFVPKILAVFISMVLFGPWMLNLMLTYTNRLFAYLPLLAR